MNRKLLFKSASFLFKNVFPVYKILYYQFKNKQDAFQLELMKELVKKGDNVLDIGANIGYYAEILSDLVGENGRVYCFEPDEINFKHLAKIAKRKNNLELIKKAVAENDGHIEIYTSDIINVEHTIYKPEHFDSSYRVEKTSVDNYIQQKFTVSFIKMDIQGAELKALEGMKQMLMTNNDIVLMTEVHPYFLLNSGTTPYQMIEFIQSLEFNIYLIGDVSLKELNDIDVKNFRREEEYFYNILCLKNSSKSFNNINQFLN